MYAVFESGGKQHRVQPGDIVQLEKLEGEVGASVKFDQILFASNANAENPQIWLGKPYLSGASVQGEILGQGRGDKILIVKMKRRKQYRRTQGHRQNYTQLIITSVSNGAGQDASLSAEQKKTTLGQFQSHLKPRGEGLTPKTLGSRKRLAAAATAAFTSGKGAAPAKASAKAPAAKKASSKKAAE